MRKIIAIILLIVLSIQSMVVFGVDYDDITANINQINEMISQELYLEAIQECNQTKAWHNLSQGDIELLDKLKNDAEWEYNEYQKHAAKYKSGFPSYQATYRVTEYTNRYKTTAEYHIIKCNIFQYGNWMYAILAYDNNYNWSADLWDRMELVKNSIRFY